MARKIKQFRYYHDNDNDNNYPYRIIEERDDEGNITNSYQESLINKSNLISGAIFADYMPAVQIGIQTIPGTRFNLNNSYSPIVVGFSGIYEINVEDLTEITSIRFDPESMNKIDNTLNTYLFVDIVYEEGE